MHITAIIAMDRSLLIGSKNNLPWHIPEDMARFKALTLGGIVVMGKNTYFSLPPKVRPLPGRRNIVISRVMIEGVETYPSIESFIESMQTENCQECFLIGGASLYNQFFDRGLVDTVELTFVDGHHDGDIFVRDFRSGFQEIVSAPFGQGVFSTLIRR